VAGCSKIPMKKMYGEILIKNLVGVLKKYTGGKNVSPNS